MLNARILTPVLLAFLAASYSLLTQPQVAKVVTAQQQEKSLKESIDRLNNELADLQNYKARPIEDLDIDQVMVSQIARWTKTQKDYGVTITEMGGSVVGAVGQSVVQTSQLRTPNEATGFQSQEIIVKGSYIALEDFVNFLNQQVVATGASIAKVTLKGYTFEMRVQIFGKAPAQGS